MRPDMPQTMHRRTCYFTGRVQGVGFRYTVKNVAQQYNVHGFVKNLPDGRVELVMEGPDPDMARLVQDVSQRMNGYIKKVDSVEDPATGEFQQFAIKH
jgi:acylphosphatase